MSTEVSDKLKVLLPHWAEHNQQHATELRKWAKSIPEKGEITEILERAAHLLDHATECLREASEKIGATAFNADHGHEHHHHQQHHHDR